jgi:hypothetical protein
VYEGVSAEKKLVHPHNRAASKPRQEGFEAKNEETMNIMITSPEYVSGATAVHSDRKSRATKKERQSGVSESYVIVSTVGAK